MIRQYSLKRISLLLIGALPLYANIDAQIDAIRNAPLSERFKLMNAFKKEVIHMHEKERIMAISKLSSMTRSKHSSRVFEELQDHAKLTYTHKVREKPVIDIKKENDIEDNVSDKTEEYIEKEIEDQIENETEDHIEDEIEDEHEDND